LDPAYIFEINGIKNHNYSAKYNERKKEIQDRVWNALKVHVDMVKQGSGTSNTGNVARKCFEDPKKLAELLELDEELVSNISLILKLFRSGKELSKFMIMSRANF